MLEGMKRAYAELSPIASWADEVSMKLEPGTCRRARWEAAVDHLGQALKAVDDAYSALSSAERG